jgi:hypothetical protein
VDDQLTPVLAELTRSLTDFTEFNGYLALDLGEGTRRHIREAAKTRHTTADRLGSRPTGYLAKAAETVEAAGDAGGVTLRVAGAIFRRVSGPVTVTPRAKQYLTIPIHAEAVGRRASEFSWRANNKTGRSNKKGRRPRLIQGLVLIRSKKGNLLLVRMNQDGSMTPYYALKTRVVLPQDTGLLPDGAALGRIAERTARWWTAKKLRL